MGRTEMYALGGMVETIPVQATVITFAFSIVPQDTITAGKGPRSAPPFQFTFGINLYSRELFAKSSLELLQKTLY